VDNLRPWGAFAGHVEAFLAEVLMELGRADEAFALIDRSEAAPQSVAYRSIMSARAELLLAAGRPQEAVAAAEATGAAAGPIILPAYLPWRSQKARGLVLLGRREEALAVAEEELANARLWGVPGVIGSALRVCGACMDGDAAIEPLREATELLEDSSFRLERVHAHAALGLALGGDAGSDALRRALREAEACGAIRVAATVRGHLRDRGAAVPAATGAALTETERRVAAAAARGEQQRTIAQAHFLAPWQVEEHLRMARRKLGVSDDAELAAALAASTH
jgi:DNA-binding CsgD family transcriptional regulator